MVVVVIVVIVLAVFSTRMSAPGIGAAAIRNASRFAMGLRM